MKPCTECIGSARGACPSSVLVLLFLRRSGLLRELVSECTQVHRSLFPDNWYPGTHSDVRFDDRGVQGKACDDAHHEGKGALQHLVAKPQIPDACWLICACTLESRASDLDLQQRKT